MAYVIPKNAPFVIEGENGTYLIPMMRSLGIDDLGEILNIKPDTPVAEKVAITKAFLLKQAPGLENERLGDMGYFQIYMAYEKEQNLGK